MKTHRSLAMLAATVFLSLSACTGTLGSGSDSDTFTMPDVAFMAMMIPHHEQAVEMSQLVIGAEGIDDRTLALANRIIESQTSEIAIMEQWLDDAGMPAHDMPGMDGGHGGMVSETDMAGLAAASGEEANRLFLEHMIEHHEGALDMIDRLLRTGSNPELAELAETMRDDQRAEITEMQQILSD